MQATQKGLSGQALKIIAAILMVLDHIHFFYSNIYNVPHIFTQLGRLSAPIFLFLLIEGFFHTKNRKKYFLQVYFLSVAMGLVRIALKIIIRNVAVNSALVGNTAVMTPFPINGILSTFTIILAAMHGFELLKRRKISGAAICLCVLCLPYFIKPFTSISSIRSVVFLLSETVLPMHPFVSDGGTLFVVSGLAIYFFYGNRFKQALAYVIVSLSYYFYVLYSVGINLTLTNLLYPYHQWLMGFAAVFFIIYNGKRGKGSKWFFYVFYPAHVYILYGFAVMFYLNH